MHPKISQKLSFWGPGTHLGTLTVLVTLISPKMNAQGVILRPFGHQRGFLRHQNGAKGSQKESQRISIPQNVLKIHLKDIKMLPKSSQKLSFCGPETHLRTLTVLVTLFSPKMNAQGVMLRPFGHQRGSLRHQDRGLGIKKI